MHGVRGQPRVGNNGRGPSCYLPGAYVHWKWPRWKATGQGVGLGVALYSQELAEGRGCFVEGGGRFGRSGGGWTGEGSNLGWGLTNEAGNGRGLGGGEGGCRRWWEVRLTVGVGAAEEGGCCRGLEGGGRFVVARGG